MATPFRPHVPATTDENAVRDTRIGVRKQMRLPQPCRTVQISSSKNRRTSGERDYFFAPEPAPGFAFKNEGDGAAGFGFSALGFFGSRLLLF